MSIVYSTYSLPVQSWIFLSVAARELDSEFDSRLRRVDFSSSHVSDLKLALQRPPCQAAGVIGSALGLVGLVSVFCDWVR